MNELEEWWIEFAEIIEAGEPRITPYDALVDSAKDQQAKALLPGATKMDEVNADHMQSVVDYVKSKSWGGRWGTPRHESEQLH